MNKINKTDLHDLFANAAKLISPPHKKLGSWRRLVSPTAALSLWKRAEKKTPDIAVPMSSLANDNGGAKRKVSKLKLTGLAVAASIFGLAVGGSYSSSFSVQDASVSSDQIVIASVNTASIDMDALAYTLNALNIGE